jgi:hypothetical protein
VTSTIPSLNTSRFSDAPLASKFTSRCRPPAAHFYFLARGEISRSRDLCQICARELLIWTFWQIWGDERTVSYLESTTVEVPIPSLATTFSITYRHFKTEFHSVSFQNFWSAGCVCGINLGFGAVFRHPRHSAAEKLIYTRRSVKQLVLALEEFRSIGIDFRSHQEPLDTSTPMGKAMFTVIAAMAELERSIIRERVVASLEHAQRSHQLEISSALLRGARRAERVFGLRGPLSDDPTAHILNTLLVSALCWSCFRRLPLSYRRTSSIS